MPKPETNTIFAGRIFQYSPGKRLFYTSLPLLFVLFFGVFAVKAATFFESWLFGFLFFLLGAFGLGATLFRALAVRRVFKVDKEALAVYGPGFNYTFRWKDIVELVCAEGYSGQRRFYLLRVRQNMLFFAAVRVYQLFDDEMLEHQQLAQAILERLTPRDPAEAEEISEPSNIAYLFPALLLLTLTPFVIFFTVWLFKGSVVYHYFACMWFYFMMLLMICFENTTCGKLRKQTEHRLGLLMAVYGMVGLLIYIVLVTQVFTNPWINWYEKSYLMLVMLAMGLLSFKQIFRGVGKLLDHSATAPVFDPNRSPLSGHLDDKYIFKSRLQPAKQGKEGELLVNAALQGANSDDMATKGIEEISSEAVPDEEEAPSPEPEADLEESAPDEEISESDNLFQDEEDAPEKNDDDPKVL